MLNFEKQGRSLLILVYRAHKTSLEANIGVYQLFTAYRYGLSYTYIDITAYLWPYDATQRRYHLHILLNTILTSKKDKIKDIPYIFCNMQLID